MTTALRSAIVGLGAVSFEHVTKLKGMREVELVGLCDVSQTLTTAVSERFGVPGFTDYERMLADARPDVVHVITPPHTHRPLVLGALAAGAHVFAEKPISLTFEEYAEMRDAAAAADRLLVENYNYRFMPGVLEALRLLEAGELGDVVNADVSFGVSLAEPSSPYADRDVPHFGHDLPGGALRNFASHPASIVLPFIGDVERVGVANRHVSDVAQSDDELRALVVGSRGCAVITLTSNAKPAVLRLRVEATKATLEVDVWNRMSALERDGGLAKLTNGLRIGAGRMLGTGALLGRVLTSRQDYFEGLGTLLDRFYAAVRDGGEPPVTVAEMDAVNRLVDDLFSAERRL